MSEEQQKIDQLERRVSLMHGLLSQALDMMYGFGAFAPGVDDNDAADADRQLRETIEKVLKND